jgi:tetratricopeptide (TPR) repeat protein
VARGECLRCVAFGLWLLAVAVGCRSLASQGPIPESLEASRQLSQRAYGCMQQDAWPQAEALLAEAIERCPTSAVARRGYAEALWRRQAYDAAVREMETAVRLDSSDTEAAVRAGQMRLTLGMAEKALAHADQALDLDPRLASAWHLRGRALQAAGQIEPALADLNRALDLAPDNRDVLFDAAEIYRSRNQPRRALVTLQHLTDVYPAGEEPGQVLYLQGLACAALQRYDEAAACYQLACRRGLESAEVFYQLADVQLQAGRPAAADQAVRQALARDPNHQPSRRLRTRIAASAVRVR